MARSVVVDSSALVALLHRRDQHHAWAAKQAAALSQPWWTCEAAGSEAFFLLGAHGREPLLQLIARGALCIVASSSAEPNLIVALMRRYGTVPMSLADACLVRLSESLPDPVIVTTDSDFRIYRRFGRQAIPLLMPDRSLPRLLFSQHPDQPGHGPDRVFRRQRVLPDANHSPQFLPQQPQDPDMVIVSIESQREERVDVQQVNHGKSARSARISAEVTRVAPGGPLTTNMPVARSTPNFSLGAVETSGVKTNDPPRKRADSVSPGRNCSFLRSAAGTTS
jgi:predicted nucleic acid-binding protein